MEKNKDGWDEAVRLDPSLLEAAKVNATNYDPEKTVPVDMSKIGKRGDE